MAVVDCFLFANELDLLEVRLHELAPVVDRFVVVEGTRDFRDRPRDLVFAAARERFAPYHEKIRYVVVDDFPESSNPWLAEYVQRNAILRGMDDVAATDTVLLSDVDEVILRPAVATVGTPALGEIVALDMRQTYYGLSWLDTFHCQASRAVRAETLRLLTPQEIRKAVANRVVPDAGWHFSYFYRQQELVDSIIRKARSFSHSEFGGPEYLDRAYLEFCATTGLLWCTFPKYAKKLHYHDLRDGLPELVRGRPDHFSDFRLAEHDRNLAAERRAWWRYARVKAGQSLPSAGPLLNLLRPRG